MTVSESRQHTGAQQIKTENTSPTCKQSIFPSTPKIMLRPWGWEQLVLTLLAVRQRRWGIPSFLISDACNIYLLSIAHVWFSSLSPSVFFLSLFLPVNTLLQTHPKLRSGEGSSNSQYRSTLYLWDAASQPFL